MKESIIRIGEHLIQINSKSSKIMEAVKRDHKIETLFNQPLDLIIHIKEGYGGSFINFEVSVETHDDYIFYKRADYLIKVDSNFQYAEISVYDELALHHAILNLYSCFIVNRNWGILIHSSCVKDNGKAHIFSGISGAGKSTAARLSYPRELLSDEATIVKIASNEVTVFNSPFNSELDSTCKEDNLSLGSIQLLFQSLQNERIPLKKAAGLFQLIDKVFFWEHSQNETKRILSLLKKLVDTVPVYELHFQKNETFWELIS